MFSRTVEAAIREAIEHGDFDDLPGAGRRVDLSAYFETPEELRLAYSMLKNADLLPPEVELTKQISAHEDAVKHATNDGERKVATRHLQNLRLRFNVLMDGLRRRRPAP